jgi:hypothetical protein
VCRRSMASLLVMVFGRLVARLRNEGAAGITR